MLGEGALLSCQRSVKARLAGGCMRGNPSASNTYLDYFDSGKEWRFVPFRVKVHVLLEGGEADSVVASTG